MIIHRTSRNIFALFTGVALLCRGPMNLVAQDSPSLQEGGVPPLPHPEIPAPPDVIESHSPWRIIALSVLLALVLAGVIWLLVKNIKRSPKPLPPPLETAHRKLRDLLRDCASLSPDETGHRVSVIIREYQEARYAVPAPRRTKEEIYGALPSSDNRTKLEHFEPLALTCDQIAFAPRPTTHIEAEALVKSAVEALRREAYPSIESSTAEPAAAS